MNSPQLSLLPSHPKELNSDELSPAAKEALQEFAILVACQSVSKKIDKSMTPAQIAAVFYAAAVGVNLHPKQKAEMKPWLNIEEMFQSNFPWMNDSTAKRSILFERLIIQAMTTTEELMAYSGHMVSPVSFVSSAPLKSVPYWKKAANPFIWTSVIVVGFVVAMVLPQPVILKITQKFNGKK